MISRRGLLIGLSAIGLAGRSSAASASSFDVVVYGATSGGITAAIEARRQNCTVAIVGGWRESHLGGMMSGGLGYSDILSPTTYGGLARHVVGLINQASGQPDTTFAFQPRFAELVFDRLVAQHDIPVFWSRGVTRAVKDGDRIVEIATMDDQVFQAKVFIDASYEGDLLKAAGVSYRTGREASDRDNPHNGFRGPGTDDRGALHAFVRRYYALPMLPAEDAGISPFLDPADLARGLLPGVNDVRAPRIGSADRGIQAYNFRLTMTRDPKLRVDLPSRAPEGYDKRDYELLFRWLDFLRRKGRLDNPGTAITSHFLLRNEIGGGLYDVNNFGPFSTDFIGGSWHYPEASYEEREIIWKKHESWIRGFFYSLQHVNDARVPAAFRDEFRTYGLANNHYQTPYPGDEPFWPYQLYVREARRMESDFVLNASDLVADDRTAPRSGHTIAAGSYNLDSHHVQRIVARTSELRVANEGCFEIDSGGRDRIFPLPLDIILPRRRECTNLMVIFCVSATHEAFGGIRMELTLMQLGQSAGMLAAMAARHGRPIAVQDVPYGALRAALLATPEPRKPVLPLTN